MARRVAIVIPTSGRSTCLWETVDSVLASAAEYGEGAIVVVAFNGTGEARPLAEQQRGDERIQLIHLEHAGKSLAANSAARLTAADYLLFTDDDVLVPREWVRQVVGALRAGLDCVGTAVVPAWPGTTPQWYRDELGGVVGRLRQGGTELPLPAGASMASRRAMFEALGGFNEGLERGEDFDFGRRVLGAGGKYGFLNDCEVLHRVEPAMVCRRYFFWWHLGAGLQERGYGAQPAGGAALPPRYVFGDTLRSVVGVLCRPSDGRFAQAMRGVYGCALIAGALMRAYVPRLHASLVRFANLRLRAVRQA